jgi:hypothetical protein
LVRAEALGSMLAAHERKVDIDGGDDSHHRVERGGAWELGFVIGCNVLTWLPSNAQEREI